MYVLPPIVAPLMAAAAPVLVGRAVLPNTGAPELEVVGVAGSILLVVGLAFVLSTARPAYARLLLRVSVSCAILAYAVAVVAGGSVADGWDVVGLMVGVFTLSYASLAFRHLLPAARPDPVRRASRVGARRGSEPLRQLVSS